MDPARTRQTLVGVGPPRTQESALAGTTLADRYHVLELLGAGGMGAVYRAHDRELDEMVALKVIRGDAARREGLLEQFRQEVKLARRVTHVNIARTFELVTADGMVFCTMELVEGESLRNRIARDGAMAIADAVGIASALCDGLAVAHAAGVIHRDIKPENVLLTPHGRVVLADFGVAAFGSTEADGSLSGTLEYMAPEQARGEQATPATDVYAVGAVLFEMLTGLRAFAGSMTELIVAKQDIERLSMELAENLAREPIPNDLRTVVGDATAREPAARIATARELARRLAPWRSTKAEPVREQPNRGALATVVVLAPRGTERMHVAAGIHHELLRRLAATPRLRVLPRVDASGIEGTVVELVAGTDLEVTIRRDTIASSLRLPIEISSVTFAADAIASAVLEVIGRVSDADAAERLDLLLQARVHLHRGFVGIRPAHELLERGRARWPADPRIATELAGLLLRFQYMEGMGADLATLRGLVDSALAGAPELAETHVAVGTFELHTGEPVAAARAFRKAIALSPYQAEPHEGIGRMLLEAGFLSDAFARLDQALAIAPKLSSVRWEIARAYAFENDWAAHDRLVAALLAEGNDRPIARFRFALWRDRLEDMIEARDRAREVADRMSAQLFETAFSIVIDKEWPQRRDQLVELATREVDASNRRRAFLAQVSAEVAGYWGDVELTLAMLARAVEYGLFDRHWLERCPTIAAARETAEGVRLRRIVTDRANAILDAYYGESDHDTIAAVDVTAREGSNVGPLI